jgi:hypothetical protein
VTGARLTLAALEQIQAAAFEAGRRVGAEEALAAAERRIGRLDQFNVEPDADGPMWCVPWLTIAHTFAELRAEGTHEGSEQ